MISEAWDHIVEGFEYIIGFEWLSDAWEFVTGMFTDLGEFSLGGLSFGIASILFIFVLRDYMLQPFLVYMSPTSALIWGGATYLGSGLGGYLIGKKLFED